MERRNRRRLQEGHRRVQADRDLVKPGIGNRESGIGETRTGSRDSRFTIPYSHERSE
ncbi:hypothetical protein [Lysobacter gummosus]|uniref:hypothetical protein n=1 Tax=Lysobacter gummosus TaxID=262324 RepID=UPI003636228F